MKIVCIAQRKLMNKIKRGDVYKKAITLTKMKYPSVQNSPLQSSSFTSGLR